MQEHVAKPMLNFNLMKNYYFSMFLWAQNF
jgi:hypothetical protein